MAAAFQENFKFYLILIQLEVISTSTLSVENLRIFLLINNNFAILIVKCDHVEFICVEYNFDRIKCPPTSLRPSRANYRRS